MNDLPLAIAHHLIAFALAAVLAAEWSLVRAGLTSRALQQLIRFDRGYGALAGLMIVIGVVRVTYGGKGPEFYTSNPIFWAKMAAFGAVGLLSILPTIRIIGWGRRARQESSFLPSDAETAAVRFWLAGELLVFATIPLFAAAMARGIGL